MEGGAGKSFLFRNKELESEYGVFGLERFV
jgi:hypothetical protein